MGTDARILDLGSGTQRRAPHVVNLEIEQTPMVDVVGDGHNLPFADATFDAVISEAVLEHVRNPKRVVAEMYRVIKPGGYVCAAVPFLQGYHASPHDYQRWTTTGFSILFSDFKKTEAGPCAGPTAALHWIFREYVGLMCSFGSLLIAKGSFTVSGVADVSSGLVRFSVIVAPTFPHFSVCSLFCRTESGI